MEFLAGLSVVLALLVVGGGAVFVVRRRQAQSRGRRTEELAALDDRISERLAMLREGRGDAEELPERPPIGVRGDDDTAPIPALLPVERGGSWLRRLGLSDDEPGSRRATIRDAGIVLGIGVLFLLAFTQLLPAAPAPQGTPSPTPTRLAVALPSGTPNLLQPTPNPSTGEIPTVTPDITFEPTPTPDPTATQTPFVPTPAPGGGGGGGGGAPTPVPDTTPPTRPGGFGILSLSPTSVTLDWTASSDNKGVVGYRLYRNGVQVGTTAGLSFTNSGLTPSTSYTYSIRAYDAAGNLSPEAIQPVTTPAATPTPCVTVSIALSPTSATVTAGSSQSYTSTTNCGVDVTGSTSFSMSTDGACSGATCTPTTAAVQTVTGTYSGMQDTSTLTVNAAALDHITVTCSPSSVAQASSTMCSAAGFDQYGNSKGDVSSSTTWSISPDGSCDTAGVCSGFTTTGQHTVTGDAGSSITDTFIVDVT